MPAKRAAKPKTPKPRTPKPKTPKPKTAKKPKKSGPSMGIGDFMRDQFKPAKPKT